MEYIVNQQNIQKYAERLTNDLCRQFFINKAFISGPEILKFNSENQLNLLIIKNIYLNWLKETSRLKSIYFDYEDEEVKLALANFMNILSNHIKVYRSDFESLLQKSISDFILLAAAPQTFYTKECEVLAGPKISLNLLKEFSKYIKINRFVIDQIIREIETSGYTETFGGETIRFVMKSLNENPGKIENPSTTLNGLFDQLPARVNEFVSTPKPPVTRPAFLDAPREEFVQPEIPQPVVSEEPEPENKSEIENLLADNQPILSDLESESPTNQEQDVETEVISELPDQEPQQLVEVPLEEPEPYFQKTEPEPISKSESKIETEELDEKPEPQELTFQTDLVEVMPVSKAKVPFKTLVPMHYRFTFINALFGGNQQSWAEAVEKIDRASSSSEAIQMLKDDYGNTFSWEKEEDNVGILCNYIERKF